MSFKIGISTTVGVICILGAIPEKFNYAFLNYLPIIMQTTWFIAQTLFNVAELSTDLDLAFQCSVVAGLFDFFTKAALSYYVCIRLVITMRFKDARTRVMWNGVIFLSIFVCLIADMAAYFSYSVTDATPFETYLLAYVVYLFSNFFITCVEIFTIFAFCSTKYNTKTVMETLSKLHELGLMRQITVLVVSIVTSIFFMIGDYYGVDSDYNYHDAVFAVKIYVSCQLVKIMFENTIEGSSRQTSRKPSILGPSPRGSFQNARKASIISKNLSRKMTLDKVSTINAAPITEEDVTGDQSQ